MTKGEAIWFYPRLQILGLGWQVRMEVEKAQAMAR